MWKDEENEEKYFIGKENGKIESERKTKIRKKEERKYLKKKERWKSF